MANIRLVDTENDRLKETIWLEDFTRNKYFVTSFNIYSETNSMMCFHLPVKQIGQLRKFV